METQTGPKVQSSAFTLRAHGTAENEQEERPWALMQINISRNGPRVQLSLSSSLCDAPTN